MPTRIRAGSDGTVAGDPGSVVSYLEQQKDSGGPTHTYATWFKYVFPKGDWDLKYYVPKDDLLRVEYENAGNFIFGLSGREVENPGWFLDLGAGWVNQAQALQRGVFFPYGGPLGPALGDDPRDAVYSQMGQDYFDSGQYIHDYFDDPSRLPEGSLRDRAALRGALRDEAFVEAAKRLSEFQGLRQDEAHLLAAEERRRGELAAKAAREKQQAEQREKDRQRAERMRDRAGPRDHTREHKDTPEQTGPDPTAKPDHPDKNETPETTQPGLGGEPGWLP